jgi:hypothetical protein
MKLLFTQGKKWGTPWGNTRKQPFAGLAGRLGKE